MDFITSADSINEQDYIILVKEERLYASIAQNWRPLQFKDIPKEIGYSLQTSSFIFVDNINNQRCYVVEYQEMLDEVYLSSLRSHMHAISDFEYQLASRSLQLMTWYKQHQFCGQCGRRTQFDVTEKALSCAPCNLTYYPRISPCMMCLIVRGEECLLARHGRHPEGFYATLAGFVEAGESLEQTVHREVFEEVGLKVKNLSYFSSQSWPFPHQLMVGYFAEYDSGDIDIDNEEIVDAQWFHYSNLPIRPNAESLSGQLIDAFIASHSK